MTAIDMNEMAAGKSTNKVKEKPSEAMIVARILMSVLLFVALWAASFMTWGVPGLYIPAVALVPVIVVALVVITRG